MTGKPEVLYHNRDHICLAFNDLVVGHEGDSAYVDDFAAHIPLMQGFHQRYMCSNKVTRLWARMVRNLDVEMIVPQHGLAFKGETNVKQFLDWISDLECGVDVLRPAHFEVPSGLI